MTARARSDLCLSNKRARHTAICRAELHANPGGPCDSATVLSMIEKLGYVQQDPLNVVARAHDHILWSRCSQYRPAMLHQLMTDEREVFEHFCHDACVLPMSSLPYWKKQFERRAERLSGRNRYTKKESDALLKRIRNEGPLCSGDFKSAKPAKPKTPWSKPRHKQMLDYLWLKGELGVAKRVKFLKYYDLAERIYPPHLMQTEVDDDERVHWLCLNAMQRLGFGSAGDITRFWEACTLDETRRWTERQAKQLSTIKVQCANGEFIDVLTHKTSCPTLHEPPEPSGRLRILSPFDPLLRDRKRLLRLFGFDYRIEIYKPASQRQYGYYVYPLLEFDQFVGRIEVKHDRQSNCLVVDNLWQEPGIKFGKGRLTRLNSELNRLKRFCGADSLRWLDETKTPPTAAAR